LDSLGNFIWVKGISGIPGLSTLSMKSLFVDSLGNVYSTGDFEGTVDFDPGVGVNKLTSNGGKDIFILKLDSSGNHLWAKSMGGTLTQYSGSIAVDGNGSVISTGVFYGTVDFDPGTGTSNLTSNGNKDILKPNSFSVRLI